jgi:predicted transposase/invertase (TIGR01784 family)
MADKILSPLGDHVFSFLFGDQRNITILKSFLKSVLDLPEEDYDTLTLVNPFLKRIWKGKKQGIVDVRVNTKSGRVIHVELQVEPGVKLRYRILYYACKLLWEQLKRGDEYQDLNQVVSIVICDHELIQEEKSCINDYGMRNKVSNKLFTDLLKVITIELPKVPMKEGTDPVWPWIQFFKSRTIEEFDMLARKHPEVKEAVTVLKKISWSEKHRQIAEAKRLAHWDEIGRIEYAQEEARKKGLKAGLEEGLEKGLEKGRQEGEEKAVQKAYREKLQIAQGMKELGISLENISAVTHLSREELANL